MSRTILIVVEEDGRAAALAELLAPLDRALLVVVDAAKAVARMGEPAPDAIVLSVDGPAEEAIETLTLLRGRYGVQVPMLVSSDGHERAFRLMCMRAGAALVERPIDGDVLREQVEGLLATKREYDELALAHRELVEFHRQQREVLRAVVHDIRTPLMVVDNAVTFVRETVLTGPPDLDAALVDAVGSMTRVNELVGDLTIVGRIEWTQMALQRTRFALAPLVEEVAARHADTLRARRQSLARTNEEVALWADRPLFRHALASLVEVALRQTPADGRLAVRAETSGTTVRLVISSSAVRPTPRPESEIDPIGPRRGAGRAGPALRLAERVVEAHGGRILVESSTEWPTSFVIEVPSAPE